MNSSQNRAAPQFSPVKIPIKRRLNKTTSKLQQDLTGCYFLIKIPGYIKLYTRNNTDASIFDKSNTKDAGFCVRRHLLSFQKKKKNVMY